MKRGIVLAAVLAVAAMLAGCDIYAVIPAFLLPGGRPTPTAAESAAPVPEVTPLPSPTPSPTASESPTAAPTATPMPTASPYEITARYESTMPEGLAVELKYANYAVPQDYFVALKSGKVHARPDAESKKLASFSRGARYTVDMQVLSADGKSKWYHVRWTDKKGDHEGYIRESAGQARSFRIPEMLARAVRLKEAADAENTVFIVNYKNRTGKPPALPGGGEEDAYGYRRSQSAPAYAEPDRGSAFRYAPDGLLGTRMETVNGMVKVHFPSFGESLWIPEKYLSDSPDCISGLTQAVVVDRLYQNAAVFTYEGGGWKLTAMSYVSTGKTGGYSLKTPLGDFMAQEKVSKFYYYADGTTTIDGYAPWGVRFSAGGYLHGVPRQFRYDANGKRIDPGLAESLSTLGTTPQSHMCVRNYTSFAKFVYDWYVKGQCAVIVIE